VVRVIGWDWKDPECQALAQGGVRYDDPGTEAQITFFSAQAGLSPGDLVLDVGCGAGRHAVGLARRGYRVVGLDPVGPYLVRGMREAIRAGLAAGWVQGDVFLPPFGPVFRAALVWKPPAEFFSEERFPVFLTRLAGVLVPGGSLMLTVPNREWIAARSPRRSWRRVGQRLVLYRKHFDPVTSLEHTRDLIINPWAGRLTEVRDSFRRYSRDEVQRLLTDSGFRTRLVAGGPDGKGPPADAPDLIWVCTLERGPR